jgi:hypothetical protein
MKPTRRLTSTYVNVLGASGTLSGQSLSKAHPEPLRGVARGVLAGIGIALCFMPLADGSKPIQYVSYKEYALHLLHYDYVQYKCLASLYGKESAWDPEAIGNLSGTQRVYGIPQGKSEWLKDQDGYAQVRWGLSYIYNRYYTPCIAWQHFKDKGWH